MKILAILLQIIADLQKYGPAGLAIITKVEGYVQKGDWLGLIAYLESVLADPPAGVTTADVAPHVAALKAAV